AARRDRCGYCRAARRACIGRESGDACRPGTAEPAFRLADARGVFGGRDSGVAEAELAPPGVQPKARSLLTHGFRAPLRRSRRDAAMGTAWPTSHVGDRRQSRLRWRLRGTTIAKSIYIAK